MCLCAPLCSMSTSEPMTLSLHYVGKGGEDEQHARIDYDDTATGAKAFIVDLPPKIQDMVRTVHPSV